MSRNVENETIEPKKVTRASARCRVLNIFDQAFMDAEDALKAAKNWSENWDLDGRLINRFDSCSDEKCLELLDTVKRNIEQMRTMVVDRKKLEDAKKNEAEIREFYGL